MQLIQHNKIKVYYKFFKLFLCNMVCELIVTNIYNNSPISTYIFMASKLMEVSVQKRSRNEEIKRNDQNSYVYDIVSK